MQERDEHTINVIKSSSGVNLYSSVDLVGRMPKVKEPIVYASFKNAEENLTKELHTHYAFKKAYDKLKLAEKLIAGFMFVRNIADQLSNKSGQNDLVPLLGIAAIYAVTEFANEVNRNDAVYVKHKLVAVKEAIASGKPMYQKAFPLFEER